MHPEVYQGRERCTLGYTRKGERCTLGYTSRCERCTSGYTSGCILGYMPSLYPLGVYTGLYASLYASWWGIPPMYASLSPVSLLGLSLGPGPSEPPRTVTLLTFWQESREINDRLSPFGKKRREQAARSGPETAPLFPFHCWRTVFSSRTSPLSDRF